MAKKIVEHHYTEQLAWASDGAILSVLKDIKDDAGG